jgi:hypothetical protein
VPSFRSLYLKTSRRSQPLPVALDMCAGIGRFVAGSAQDVAYAAATAAAAEAAAQCRSLQAQLAAQAIVMAEMKAKVSVMKIWTHIVFDYATCSHSTGTPRQ